MFRIDLKNKRRTVSPDYNIKLKYFKADLDNSKNTRVFIVIPKDKKLADNKRTVETGRDCRTPVENPRKLNQKFINNEKDLKKHHLVYTNRNERVFSNPAENRIKKLMGMYTKTISNKFINKNYGNNNTFFKTVNKNFRILSKEKSMVRDNPDFHKTDKKRRKM